MTAFQFMCEEAVVELHMFIGPVLANFGTEIPFLPKFKARSLWSYLVAVYIFPEQTILF